MQNIYGSGFLVATLFPTFLDAFFTLPALCLINNEAADAARLIAFCTTPVALQFLTQPRDDHNVCAAAALAVLSGLDGRFVGHLADGAHLETLLDAAFQAATAADDVVPQTMSCSRAWHTTVLLIAVAHAARACHIAAPAVANAAAEDAERVKRPRVGLDASDMGVQHHSSTVFLIAARPFYVQSLLLEKVSPVLKQAMEAAGGSREPIALPLAIDAPADRHHALFGLAVEFAYTGAISRLSSDEALPLYTLAEFLQIDALRTYLIDTRLQSLMHADLSFTERVWAAAMTFPALQEAAATAIVDHLPRRKREGKEDVARSMLRRCHETSAVQSPLAVDHEQRLPWVVHLFAQIMRVALRSRVAGAAAGAAGAA